MTKAMITLLWWQHYWTIMMTQGGPGLPTSTTTTTTVLSPEAGLCQVKNKLWYHFFVATHNTGCSLPIKELRIQPEAILELNDEFNRAAALVGSLTLSHLFTLSLILTSLINQLTFLGLLLATLPSRQAPRPTMARALSTGDNSLELGFLSRSSHNKPGCQALQCSFQPCPD